MRAYLDATTTFIERTRAHCDTLLQNLTSSQNQDAERETLHLRARLDGLSRQIRDAAWDCQRLARILIPPETKDIELRSVLELAEANFKATPEKPGSVSFNETDEINVWNE